MKRARHVYTPAEVLEDYAERAAIMEYDGGLTRETAERLAWEAVRKNYGTGLMVAARKLVQS